MSRNPLENNGFHHNQLPQFDYNINSGADGRIQGSTNGLDMPVDDDFHSLRNAIVDLYKKYEAMMYSLNQTKLQNDSLFKALEYQKKTIEYQNSLIANYFKVEIECKAKYYQRFKQNLGTPTSANVNLHLGGNSFSNVDPNATAGTTAGTTAGSSTGASTGNIISNATNNKSNTTTKINGANNSNNGSSDAVTPIHRFASLNPSVVTSNNHNALLQNNIHTTPRGDDNLASIQNISNQLNAVNSPYVNLPTNAAPVANTSNRNNIQSNNVFHQQNFQKQHQQHQQHQQQQQKQHQQQQKKQDQQNFQKQQHRNVLNVFNQPPISRNPISSLDQLRNSLGHVQHTSPHANNEALISRKILTSNNNGGEFRTLKLQAPSSRSSDSSTSNQNQNTTISNKISTDDSSNDSRTRRESDSSTLTDEGISSPDRLSKRHKMDPLYKPTKMSDNIKDIVEEYLHGVDGGPAIRDLEREHGAKWRGGAHHPISKKYGRMKSIYDAVNKGLELKFTVDEIVDLLESARIFQRDGVLARKSVTWLQDNIPEELKS